jgi:hypothetical protein
MVLVVEVEPVLLVVIYQDLQMMVVLVEQV